MLPIAQEHKCLGIFSEFSDFIMEMDIVSTH